MISKQISTYEKKIKRAKEIINLRMQRVKNNERLIKLIDSYIKENKKSDDPLVKIKILELENQKIELLQSNIENSIAIRIQNEILNEDIAANDRLKREFSELEAEINSGKWDEYVEMIKQTAMNIRRRNPKADTSRLTNAVARSYEPFENDAERIDHFRVLKKLSQIKG
jgi:hypothetical protein